jgi:hypothetical protein
MRAGGARNLCAIYRRNESRDAFGDVGAGWAAIAEQAWVDIKRDGGTLVDYGAGDQQRAPAKGRAHFLADIRERDVLSVTAGPDEGSAWLVEAVFHPDGRDKDLSLSQFTGSLA